MVNSKKHLLIKKSLGCFGQHNKLRTFCVRIMFNKLFDHFITSCIIVNSLLLASKQYEGNYDQKFISDWNQLLDLIDLIFSVIFLLECLIKILATGFIGHKKAYMRDGWNWIDFFIVCISMLIFIPGIGQNSLKALRTTRILRPLRSLHKLESMKRLIQTIFASIPGLFNVCVFQTFIFTIFAIISLNFFVGKQY